MQVAFVIILCETILLPKLNGCVGQLDNHQHRGCINVERETLL